MTSKTRNFIELSDLLGLQLECAKCRTAVTIPLADLDRDAPKECPNCKHRWGIAGDERPTQSYIREATDALSRLKQQMSRDSLGFTLTFEVTSKIEFEPE